MAHGKNMRYPEAHATTGTMLEGTSLERCVGKLSAASADTTCYDTKMSPPHAMRQIHTPCLADPTLTLGSQTLLPSSQTII